jgi:hypothetical protein
MWTLPHLFGDDDVLTLEGARLNEAIARQLGYRQGKDVPSNGHSDEWFSRMPGRPGYEPIGAEAMQFSTNTALALALALPDPTDCCEDWIHTEMGPQGRWIVRLIRFYRAHPDRPWKSKELYVADRDDTSVPVATAYGRAWLFSHSTWPAAKRSPADTLKLAS